PPVADDPQHLPAEIPLVSDVHGAMADSPGANHVEQCPRRVLDVDFHQLHPVLEQETEREVEPARLLLIGIPALSRAEHHLRGGEGGNRRAENRKKGVEADRVRPLVVDDEGLVVRPELTLHLHRRPVSLSHECAPQSLGRPTSVPAGGWPPAIEASSSILGACARHSNRGRRAKAARKRWQRSFRRRRPIARPAALALAVAAAAQRKSAKKTT